MRPKAADWKVRRAAPRRKRLDERFAEARYKLDSGEYYFLMVCARGDSPERAEVVSLSASADGRLDKLKKTIDGRDAAEQEVCRA